MRLSFFYILLFLQVGCATKYIIPGSRFMTPESQGGGLNSQFEFQQATATQLTADVTGNTVDNGVEYESIPRTGFAFATSLLDQFDLFWTHTGGANSLLGAKYQFLGASRTAKGAGHKMAVTAAFGSNEHETDDSDAVEFELGGKELQLLYGYRFSEIILAYTNLSYANYTFTGEIISKDPAINGLKPDYETKVTSLYGGLEFSVAAFFAKLECGYQQLATTDTKDESHFIYGYSLGVTW